MESGKIVEKGGIYCCLYHQKNKIKIITGTALPRCDFAGVRCEGYWHLLREIKEKTPQESYAGNNKKRYQYKRTHRDETYPHLTDKKFNKWDFEKW
jgi:hypothetical protein